MSEVQITQDDLNIEDTPMIKISVRNLVEFILREGDIDNRISGDKAMDAMQQGAKIHRKIQRMMGSNYNAEVPLKIDIEKEDYILRIEGRADGIIHMDHKPNETDSITIDEIKGVFKDVNKMQEPVGVHLAQAKCYAYIYGTQHGLSNVNVQMTYCNMDTEEIRRFQVTYNHEELRIWFEEVVNQYHKWAKFQVQWRKERNASAQKVEFPFKYREGQKELVASVYRTMLRKKKLFIQAPTGVGKTMATIFPAVKAVGEGLGDKIFYLTAKTITRTVAEQAFHLLKKQDLQYKVITLTAKEKICMCETKDCNPDLCPYAKGHYDRVNDAVFDLLQSGDDFSRTAIEEQAEKWKVCPFEMSLDLALWVDAVICDYNYLFDPNAKLRRFFSEGSKEEYLFLIDEAHNLVERGREMFSATLVKEEFLEAKKLVKYEDGKLAKKLDACNKQMLELKRECESYQVLDGIGHFSLKLLNLMTELERFMEECTDPEVKNGILELYFHVRTFLRVYESLDENYVIYTQMEQNGTFSLKLFCVNPAVNIQECLDKGNSTVYFSATLLPINYYKKLLSKDTDDYAIYAKSPFNADHRLLAIGQDVTTKYTARGEVMYGRYAAYIRNVIQGKCGNYLVFFPSYRFMQDVYEAYLALEVAEPIKAKVILQSAGMNETKREEFLEAFEEENQETLVGFCVLGGVFSEGIDLDEEKLIGAMIVGTGLPQVCYEREILKDYFDQIGEDGFAYSYLYPGMNKVLQSAGRVIRTDTDRGVIFLLDERFLGRQYQNLFPREWSNVKLCSSETAEPMMNEFWTQTKSE